MKNKTKQIKNGERGTGTRECTQCIFSEKDHSTNNNLFLISPFSGKKTNSQFS